MRPPSTLLRLGPIPGSRLSVTGRYKSDGSGKRKWEAACRCGGVIWRPAYMFASGEVRSCGCLGRESRIKHGGNGTPEYKAWENMISRCENRNTPYYKHYGGRGIKVCPRWRGSFAAFLEDMGPRPSPRHELDRFPDNDGDYEPGNCRWATRRQQLNNIRNNVRITVGGVTKTVNEWSEISGIHPATIKSRLEVGRSPEQAVFGKKYAQQLGDWE